MILRTFESFPGRWIIVASFFGLMGATSNTTGRHSGLLVLIQIQESFTFYDLL